MSQRGGRGWWKVDCGSIRQQTPQGTSRIERRAISFADCRYRQPLPKYLIPKRLELSMDYKPIYYFPVPIFPRRGITNRDPPVCWRFQSLQDFPKNASFISSFSFFSFFFFSVKSSELVEFPPRKTTSDQQNARCEMKPSNTRHSTIFVLLCFSIVLLSQVVRKKEREKKRRCCVKTLRNF